ncbi:RhoGAP-domain-containing protein [Backusella circina FSU 941]|nr:RhoGAP-domain-containing protein [Backusella circina FSU 941]
MICQNPPTGPQTNQFSLSLHSNPLKENPNGAKRYSPSTYHKFEEMQEPNSKKQNCSMTETPIKTKGMSDIAGESFSNMVFGSKYSSHWEVVEGYFVEHLTSLQSEIEMCRKQKDQLTKARDELIQEVLRLNQKTVDLNSKNEHLTRTIAEKENKISAFMYEPSAGEENSKKSNGRRSVVGVTLTDAPYSPEVATNNNDIIQSYVPDDGRSKPAVITISQHSNSNQDATKVASSSKKENTTGIFRQLSRKISRKKKNHDENTSQNSNSSKNNNSQTQSGSSSSGSRSGSLSSNSYDMQTEDLLHPAVVISATDDKREDRAIKDPTYKKRNCLMFGNNIVDQARSENAFVPYVVLKCVREVEFRGLKVEGIYRKSGSYNQITELKDAFDHNKTPDLSRYDDVNVISSLLKLYLRELPQPLLSQEFIFDPSLDIKTRLSKTYQLLHSLPTETYSTVKTIMQHLKRVHQHHSLNRMTSKNIAVVFGPTLMRFKNHGNEEHQMNSMIQTVDFIIAQSHMLFADF